MKTRLNITLMLLFLLGLAKLNAQPKEMYAVLVGMSDYQYPVNPILNGQMTANMIRYRLKADQNWNDNNINPLNDPTEIQIQNAVQAMPKNSTTINFFYYVGHGTQEGLFLLNEYGQYSAPTVSPSELQSYFGSFNDYCAFIDACYSGVFADQMTTGVIGTSSSSTESTWGGSISGYTTFGGALGKGISKNTNPIPIGTLTAEGLFYYAKPIVENTISGMHPQISDNYPGNLLITTPAYDVTFVNNFVGLSNQGTIVVDGVSYTLPYTARVYYGTTITVQAQSQVINGIQYTFTTWDNGSTSYSRNITVTSNITVTANYSGRPNNGYRNLRDIGAVGEPIILDWEEHPNVAVTQYQIWRIVKHNGVVGAPSLLTTKNRGTTIYTDPEYVKASTYVDLLQYDVRAYYQTEGTYSNPDFMAVYGEGGILLPKENDTTAIGNKIDNGFVLSNFPNPFNPSTNINFTMPEAANVKLTIYNMLGEKVKELLNGNMGAGSYTTQWNGDDQYGNKVISGVYFSVLQTNNKRIVQKMILSK